MKAKLKTFCIFTSFHIFIKNIAAHLERKLNMTILSVDLSSKKWATEYWFKGLIIFCQESAKIKKWTNHLNTFSITASDSKPKDNSYWDNEHSQINPQ